jgi:hypothetical protein
MVELDRLIKAAVALYKIKYKPMASTDEISKRISLILESFEKVKKSILSLSLINRIRAFQSSTVFMDRVAPDFSNLFFLNQFYAKQPSE